MLVRTTRAEWIAREFHRAYEELAPGYGYETRKDSAVPWDEVPPKNRALMIGVVTRLIKTGIIK